MQLPPNFLAVLTIYLQAVLPALKAFLTAYNPEWEKWTNEYETIDPLMNNSYLARLIVTPALNADEIERKR